MTIALLGGAGFVGINLALEALKNGHRICIFDRGDFFGTVARSGALEHRGARFFDIDLAARVPDFPSDVNIAINLAALPHVEYSMYEPATAVRNNIDIQVNVLEAVRRRKIPLLFVSSVEVYGGNDGGQFEEDSRYLPLSPYAASKVSCEQILNSYSAAFKILATTVRLTNLYGPWQFPDRLVPRLIARFLSGCDCEVDSLRLRDFVHVQDAAKAILHILVAEAWGNVFNIASGIATTTRSIATLVAENFGATDRLQVADQRVFDGRGYSLVSSGARLTARTGWTPALAISDGLRETCDWYRDNEAWWAQFAPSFRADRTGPEYIVDFCTWRSSRKPV